MMLFENFYEQCQLIEKKRTPDGLGGFTTTWEPGPEFMAAVIKDSSLQARVAQKEGVTEVYTVTFSKGLDLEFHDVFRRAKDGLTYRVTSNVKDSETPDGAGFQFGQATAERWDLPK